VRPSSARGFSLIELLVVIAIIGTLSTIAFVAVQPAIKKGRDTARKAAISQIGRFLASGGRCYMPTAGYGDYDIGELFAEVVAANPQISNFIKEPPKDPRGGTNEETKYRYAVDANGCALYANLENQSEEVTLPTYTDVTPGGGSGVFRANDDGPNGTPLYIQAAGSHR
jgi:prepilin-type N-terminal cleavage/methylation domain-containing protein